MDLLNNLATTLGWLVFLYLGGAGVYELIGNRRYRASLLLVAAFFWIILTLVYFRYATPTRVGWIFILLYLAACYFLVRKVHADLGKPDIR